MNQTKMDFLNRGEALMRNMCATNGISMPHVRVRAVESWPDRQVTAWYVDNYIEICPTRTAQVGKTGAAWSYPGYTVDKTAYGVLQHELGHHFDLQKSLAEAQATGAFVRASFSASLHARAQEDPISSYLGDDPAHAREEWFAESFRLFATNPDLLRLIRPRTWQTFFDAGLRPVITDDWRTVLRDAPERTIRQAEKKIAAARMASRMASKNTETQS